MRALVSFCAAGLAALILPAAAFAQAGELDTTFSGDGKVLTNTTPGYDYAGDLAVQLDDGKIVAAGAASGLGGRVVVLRYNADGALDTSFSGDGKVLTNLTSGDDGASAVEIQSDGKIVVAGWAGGRGGRFAVLRYNPDGTLDPSFSGDGKTTTDFSSGDDFAYGLVLQPDGKIVAAGRAGGAGGRMAVARYQPDGTLDPSFSGDGRVATNFTSGYDIADHPALQADGKIVVAGTADYTSRRARFALARYLPDGGLDPTFSGDGRVTTNLTTGFDGAFGIGVQQADGTIVASGQAGSGNAGRMALARYLPDGMLDPSFSGDGLVTTNFTAGLDYGEELELQADGKIVVAGTANYYGNDARFALARFLSDGILDTGFSGDGKVTTNFTSGFDGAFGLAIQPADGKIVAGGVASGQGGRFAIARYLTN